MSTDATRLETVENPEDTVRARRFFVRMRWTWLALDLFVVLLVGIGVFVALPVRYLPVDVPAALLLVALLASAFGLFRRATWSDRVFRAVAFYQLAVGLVLTVTAVCTASYLSGVYGPVGRGGSVILALVATLALPYLVVLPAVKLLWVGPSGRAAVITPAAPAAPAALAPVP